jgi:uncharacterized protein YggE
MTSIRMQRWTMVVVLATLVAGLLVVIGVGRSGPDVARAADTVGDDTVSVIGVGTTEGTPDTLTVNFGVRVTRTSVADALDARSHAARRLIDTLRAEGLGDKDLQTTDLSLYRTRKRHDPTHYYVASESVQATIAPLTDAGRIIDSAARSSSHVSIGGMSFDIADDDALITEARANAYADAKDKAEQYADLAGRTLARVERVSETVRNPQPVYYGAAAAARSSAPAAPAPIEAGTQTVRVRVTIIWQLA